MKLFYKGNLLSEDISIAKTYYTRLRGLMFYKDIRKNEGLFFPNCNWIHSFFMFFNIDVLYLDKDFKVVKIIKNLRPFKLVAPVFKAKHLIEFKSSILDKDTLYNLEEFKCLDFYV